MADPITPKFMADEVLLQTLAIEFNQTWDGANWVIDPTTILLRGQGSLAESGTIALPADIEMFVSDLPMAGQTAVQDLWSFLEAEMATKYG